jgi:Origin recognition complex (ORC) subunit 5 C-terminus
MTGVPHIHFPPYARSETLKIVSNSPQAIFLTPIDPKLDYSDEEAAEDSIWLWSRYCGVVWDSLAKGAARDLDSFRSVCLKLWRPFVQPIVDNTYGTRDFTRLMVSRRMIFQSEEVLMGDATFSGTTGITKPPAKGSLFSRFSLNATNFYSYSRTPLLRQICSLCSVPGILQSCAPRLGVFHEKQRKKKKKEGRRRCRWKALEASKGSYLSTLDLIFSKPSRSRGIYLRRRRSLWTGYWPSCKQSYLNHYPNLAIFMPKLLHFRHYVSYCALEGQRRILLMRVPDFE